MPWTGLLGHFDHRPGFLRWRSRTWTRIVSIFLVSEAKKTKAERDRR